MGASPSAFGTPRNRTSHIVHPACTMRVSSGLPGSIAAPAVSSASTVRCRGCPGSLWSTSPGPRCISGVWWLLEGPGDSSCRKATGSCWLGFQNDWLPGPPATVSAGRRPCLGFCIPANHNNPLLLTEQPLWVPGPGRGPCVCLPHGLSRSGFVLVLLLGPLCA